MGALNLPSASDIERLTRRVRSVSQRLEGIEDGLDRLEDRLDRSSGASGADERLEGVEAPHQEPAPPVGAPAGGNPREGGPGCREPGRMGGGERTWSLRPAQSV